MSSLRHTNVTQAKLKLMNFSIFLLLRQATVGMFDNVLFDNYLDLVRQFKNRSFLGVIFLPVTGRNKN
jgi:hypothetical protein